MKKGNRIAAGCILAIAAVAGLAGCRDGKATEGEKIRVAYHSNFGASSADSAAVDMHYFDEEGLDVELLEFSRPSFHCRAGGRGRGHQLSGTRSF